jgi:Aminoglycoside adenylyltransferase, C-terminal domain
VTATPFAELNELLARFLARISSILGANLTGVYLTGSFALGDGDAASDCDFLAVTGVRPGGDDERALRDLHAEIPGWPSYWAYNFEGSYAPQADLTTLGTLGEPWLYVNRGGREMEWSPHCNTADVRWVLVNRPAVLAGPDPRTLACDVPAAVLQETMRPLLENFLIELGTWASFDVSWTQRYAVAAASRMLFTLQQGEVISKKAALDWAADALPAEWRSLIEQVESDRFVPWNDPPRAGSVERTVAFVKHVQECARARQRSGESRL